MCEDLKQGSSTSLTRRTGQEYREEGREREIGSHKRKKNDQTVEKKYISQFKSDVIIRFL